MADTTLAIFGAMVATLFVAELSDKDALLILAFATRLKPARVFFAGSLAFVLTTTIIVSFGTLLITVVPLLWVQLAGGGVMLAYGLVLASRIARRRPAENPDRDTVSGGQGGKTFFAMVGSLALLDLAGDATEVLIIVLLARYGNPLLVFSASCTGLIAATAAETALGNTLGRVLTPRRLLYLSTCVFLGLGAYIIAFNL